MPPPPLSSSLHRSLLHLLRHHCRTLPQLTSIHALLTTAGLLSLHPASTLPSLLLAFSHLPNLSPTPHLTRYPLSLFRLIPNPSTFPFNLLIQSLTLLSSPSQSLLLFSRMRRLSIPPDSHTFPFTLKACSHLPSLPLARSLHSQALRFGFLRDLFVINSLLSVYSTGSVADARQVFDEIPSPDVVSYNTLIDAYVKIGDVVLARALFDRMHVRDLVSWGTLLAGYSRTHRCAEGLSLFDDMVGNGLKPDDVALVSALSCCAKLGALDRGKEIHEHIRRRRRNGVTSLSVYLSTAIVDMYAKCGCIGLAVEAFEASPTRNLFTWNAIIVGLATHGDGELALEYFERMRRGGVRPDEVTFLGVLVGCSHAGLTDVARRILEEMRSVYGVEPELKHYGCMADLLGRAGLIDEALEMIEAMPMEGDRYVWGGVLGGCRIHGRVEVAEMAARHLLELSPEDSGIYSVMAGMYASARRWEDVARMRRLMEDRRVKKNVGCSSVQLDVASQNHFFSPSFC